MSMQPPGWWQRRERERQDEQERNSSPHGVLSAIADLNELVGDVLEVVQSQSGSGSTAITQLITDKVAEVELQIADIGSAHTAAIQQLSDKLDAGLAQILDALVGPPVTGPGPAVSAVTTVTPQPNVQGGQVPATVTVDSSGAISTVWSDDKNDTNATAPLGADGQPVVLTYASDNPAVATVAGTTVTGVTEGSGNVTTTVTNTDGTPANWPANTPNAAEAGQPITIAPAPFTVGPGLAVSGTTAA